MPSIIAMRAIAGALVGLGAVDAHYVASHLSPPPAAPTASTAPRAQTAVPAAPTAAHAAADATAPRAAATALAPGSAALDRVSLRPGTSALTAPHVATAAAGATAARAAAITTARATAPAAGTVIYFALRSALVDPAAVAAYAGTTAQLTVIGFTDATGEPSFNQTLRWQRAFAVRDALIHAGVRADRIVARVAPDADATATDPATQWRDRRVEIHITAGGPE